jgi:hypothetical protein
MSEQYKYKPKYDQVKFISKYPSTNEKKKFEKSANDEKNTLFQPRDALMAILLIAFLIFLFFATKRMRKMNQQATLLNAEQLKRLDQNINNAQKMWMESSRANSTKTDEMFQSFAKHIQQMIETPKVNQTLVTQPTEHFTIPSEHNNEGDEQSEGNLNLLHQCQEDGSGACSEFKRRQSTQKQTIHPSNEANAQILPRLLSAISTSGPRSRSY